jgi:hypothetical protein
MKHRSALVLAFLAAIALIPQNVFAQAQLAVNGVVPPGSTSVVAGSSAMVAVSAGPGNVTDWLGLYAAGIADANPITWTYLGGSTAPPATGLSDATLRFQVPTSAGTYEFRLFASNGYTRLATSVLTGSPSPSPIRPCPATWIGAT